MSQKSSSKQKASAQENAAERAQAINNMEDAPAAGVSEQQRSQGRFPGETPLTGEDRPTDRAGGKEHDQ